LRHYSGDSVKDVRENMARYSWAGWMDIAIKIALVTLLLLGAFSGLQQFEGKAFGWRLATYPLAAFIVPAAWLAWFRTHPYPAAGGALLTAPFLIDVAGNAFDLYDTVSWWDDANHFINWALLTTGAGLLAGRTSVGRWPLRGLLLGFGATTAILWELGEYFAFIRDSPELATAYQDTLGDLGLGLAGSALAVVLVDVWRARARPSAHRSRFG
jgi:hypothetical protein